MKKPSIRLAVGLCVSVFVCFAIVRGQQGPVSTSAFVSGEVLVQFRPEASLARRDAIVAASGGRVLRRLNEVNVHRVHVAPASTVADTISALRLNSEVISVEPN